MTNIDIVKVAMDSGFKERYIKKCKTKADRLTLPCIICTQNNKFCILAKTTKDKALILDTETGNPKLLDLPEFNKIWSREVILFKHKKIEH